jgi:protein-L-isoaspartate(D-aspartate) O-methyltransferase
VQDPHVHRKNMVEKQLRKRGITDERVLEAMAEIPRELFVPVERAAMAYEDRALPLAAGQTLSQPFMVAAMTQALRLTPDDRVLEIGTGSGYQTAVLARLAGEVFTVEVIAGLSRAAGDVLESLAFTNVRLRVGDGSGGWPEKAPFDAIMVTAGAPSLPRPLTEQLEPRGGRLVIPVGTRDLQTLRLYERSGSEITSRSLMECRFVPLVGESGWGVEEVEWMEGGAEG